MKRFEKQANIAWRFVVLQLQTLLFSDRDWDLEIVVCGYADTGIGTIEADLRWTAKLQRR